MAQPLEGMFDGKYGPKHGSAGVLLPGTLSHKWHETTPNLVL